MPVNFGGVGLRDWELDPPYVPPRAAIMPLTYEAKIAKLAEQRADNSKRAAALAITEIAKLLRQLDARFWNHKFTLDAGMGTIVVAANKPVFGDDIVYGSGDFYFDVEDRRAGRFMADIIRQAAKIAMQISDDFDADVGRVTADGSQ